MNFYEMLSQHYDVIFPRGEVQTSFIESYLKKGTKLLDIGAGLGGYSDYFSANGYDVVAIDLDETMVEGMQQKISSHKYKYDAYQMDMLDIDEFGENVFGGLVCIGNTLAHLSNYDLVNDFFEKANTVLNDGGYLIIQIVNYDRVLKEKTTELPTITRQDYGLSFFRTYEFLNDKEVMFKGRLYIKNQLVDEVYESQTELLAVTLDTVLDAAKNAGFTEVEFFGDFDKNPYEIKSPAIVLVAKK